VSEPPTDPAISPVGRIASDEAARIAAESATRIGRRQLALLLEQRPVAQRIAERFGNLGDAQRQGHVFEWMHELSFNLRAIAADDEVRLRVTTWLGEPHAPADLRAYGPAGEVLGEAQAKVVGDAAHRLSTANGLAADRYRSMQLLVPSDHLDGTTSLLDRRLAMPEGPLHGRYAEVQENLTDRVRAGSLTSAPVTTDQLADAAQNSQKYLQTLIRSRGLHDLAKAGATTAATAGLVTGLVEVGTSFVQHGSLDAFDWPETARRAARQAVQSGMAACLAEGLSNVGAHATAAGASSWAGALIESGLDAAMGRAVVDIAGVAHGIATGRLSAETAALAAAETLIQAAAGWAGGCLGQTVIPVPVVGAVLGRVVGQIGATVFVEGIRLAVTARDRSTAWDDEYDRLLRQTVELQAAATAELREVANALAAYEVAFRTHVLPRLERLNSSLATGGPDDVLADLADIERSYLGTPMFASLAEFDQLMADGDFTLVLDLGPSTSHPPAARPASSARGGESGVTSGQACCSPRSQSDGG